MRDLPLYSARSEIHTLSMNLKSKLGERGQVLIAKAIRDELSLRTGSQFEVRLVDGAIRFEPARHSGVIKAAIQRYKGSRHGVLERMGYSSVEDYLKATRGR